jgi:hypothetical protein
MPDSLTALLDRKADILRRIANLGDFRPGSISTTIGRCGAPSCHCHRPGHRGHGPSFRLTYKVQGKTVTESVPDAPTREKAEREILEYRRWQRLSRELVDLSAAICKARPVDQPKLTPR